MAETVLFDPTVPPGTEKLKLGAGRIRNIATNITRLFGFDGTVAETFVTPFTSVDAGGLLTVQGDPVQPLGIATAQYAGRKVTRIVLTSGDGVTYTGSAPTLNGFDLNALYLFAINAPTNAGPTPIVTINPGASQFSAPMVRSDNSALSATGGDLVTGNVIEVNYDGTSLRILDFIGGVTTHPVTLPANPVQSLQAAPKQYVDSVVGKPMIYNPTADVPLVGIPQPVFGPGFAPVTPITIPNDATHYFLFVAWGAHVYWPNVDNGEATTSLPTIGWISDGGNTWAMGGCRADTFAAGTAYRVMSGSGYSPVSYAPGTTVAVILNALGINAPGRPTDVNSTITVQAGLDDQSTAPLTYMHISLIRGT